MSFRKWLPSPPIGVGLVVALGLIGAGLHNHYLAPDSQRIIESGEVQLGKDNRQSPNDRDKAQSSSVRGLVEGRQHVEATSTDETCDSSYCYARENLRAQIRMAKASEELVSLTERQRIARYIEYSSWWALSALPSGQPGPRPPLWASPGRPPSKNCEPMFPSLPTSLPGSVQLLARP